MFYEAGGLIAMGTDAGTPFNKHGDNARELEYMVEYGLKPIDALIAATANAADLVRETERGRIHEGAFADLLVVDGNPVDDIAMVSQRENHRLIVKNGELVAGSSGNGNLPG